ncbi:hypothetical protein HKX48_006611 [Thoreauomyces humboldtii]|nr:hypothetical protein HKX48_006611 [Thoreauomyces humboldtii]
MKDPFLYEDQGTDAPGPPDTSVANALVTSKASKVVLSQVYPSFLSRVPVPNAEAQFDSVQDLILGSAIQGKSKGSWASLLPDNPHQLTIHPPTFTYPQHHQLDLADSTDPFSRWTFRCDPFSFRSLARRAGWMEEEGQDSDDKSFLEFGNTVRKYVVACKTQPKRYKVAFKRISKHAASLSFIEIVHDYRKIKLVSIDFDRVSRRKVEAGIRGDLEHLKDQRDKLSLHLLKTIEIISLHRPTILPSSLSTSLLQPLNHRQETQAWADEDASTTSRSSSEAEAVRSRMVPLHVASADSRFTPDGFHLPIRYVFQLYRTATAYTVTLSHPDDPFVHYTSENIDEKRFGRILENLEAVGDGTRSDDAEEEILDHCDTRRPSSSPSSRGGGGGGEGGRGWSRVASLDSDPSQNYPGVPGVLFDDFLASCTTDPDAYQALFTVHNHVACHPDHQATLQIRSRNLPDRRWHGLMSVRFEKTTRGDVNDHVRKTVAGLRETVAAQRSRLANVVQIVRNRDPALLRLVETALKPYRQDHTNNIGDATRHPVVSFDDGPSWENPPADHPPRSRMTGIRTAATTTTTAPHRHPTMPVRPTCTRVARHQARDKRMAERAAETTASIINRPRPTSNLEFRRVLHSIAQNGPERERVSSHRIKQSVEGLLPETGNLQRTTPSKGAVHAW